MATLVELSAVERRHWAADGGFVLSVPALSIAPGERIVLLGPSGSGKSTLLDLLAFLAAPDRAGDFTFAADGVMHDIAAYWRRGERHRLTRLRARHLGYVLQTGGLLPYLSVAENILLSRRLLALPGPGSTAALAESVGIAELLNRKPAQISIGQRQRVALVRAIAHEPALVLADEPTAALDGALALAVIDALTAATQRIGAALILVTHDAAVAERAGGRIVRCRPVPGAKPATSLVEASRN